MLSLCALRRQYPKQLHSITPGIIRVCPRMCSASFMNWGGEFSTKFSVKHQPFFPVFLFLSSFLPPSLPTLSFFHYRIITFFKVASAKLVGYLCPNNPLIVFIVYQILYYRKCHFLLLNSFFQKFFFSVS